MVSRKQTHAPRKDPEVTRRLLTRAAQQEIIDTIGSDANGHSVPLVAVPIQSVLDRAARLYAEEYGVRPRPGFSHGSVYNTWQDRDHFIREVSEAYLEPDGISFDAEVLAPARTALTAGESGDRVYQIFAEADFVSSCQDHPDWTRLWLLFLAHSRRPDVATTVSRLYEDFDARLLGFYRDLLGRWGRRPAPGFDLPDLALAHAAVIQGLAMRELAGAGGRVGSPPPRHYLGTGAGPGIVATAGRGVLFAMTEPGVLPVTW
jgi:AcrR family transcriptional regulator